MLCRSVRLMSYNVRDFHSGRNYVTVLQPDLQGRLLQRAAEWSGDCLSTPCCSIVAIWCGFLGLVDSTLSKS